MSSVIIIKIPSNQDLVLFGNVWNLVLVSLWNILTLFYPKRGFRGNPEYYLWREISCARGNRDRKIISNDHVFCVSQIRSVSRRGKLCFLFSFIHFKYNELSPIFVRRRNYGYKENLAEHSVFFHIGKWKVKKVFQIVLKNRKITTFTF